jgi:hypothetical protein
MLLILVKETHPNPSLEIEGLKKSNSNTLSLCKRRGWG